MIEKRLLDSRVWMVADLLGVEQTKVKRIVVRYFDNCREELFAGKVVRILGFVTLTPNIIVDDFISTTAVYCKQVSIAESLPYYSVREIMRTYFDICKQELMEGRTVDFRALATLHPLLEDDRVTNIRVSISATLKDKLIMRNSGVTSARASICKLLKSELCRNTALEVSKL